MIGKVQEDIDPIIKEHILTTVTSRPFVGEYDIEIDPEILDPDLQKIFGMAIKY